MIAVVFALPQESRDFVAALRTGRIPRDKVVLAHVGMGSDAARAALQRAWEGLGEERIEGVIGAGFAGGLDPSLPAGTLLLAQNHPGWLTKAHEILGDRARIVPLASIAEVLETPQAKADCARRTGAAAADMESAAVAAFCREKGVPFLALRVISDAAGEPLPVPSAVWFDAAAQRPRPLALLGFLLRHPKRIPSFVRFIHNIRRSRRILTAALMDLVNGLGDEDKWDE